MRRFLAPISTIALLAAAASAQCFEPAFGVLAPRAGFPAGLGDDALLDLQPLNFAFPMAGVSPTYTHAHIQTNGVLFLTNGAVSGATATGYSTTPATQLTNLRGLAFEPPRIAPLWRDLDNLAVNGGGVFFNNTVPGKFVVTWSNTVEFGATAVFTVQTQLFATGEVHFFYNGSLVGTQATIVGVSQGNAVAAVPSVNLTAIAGNSGTSKLMFQQFAANSIDLQNRFLQFVPNVLGGYDETATDCGAFNQNYGRGCYDISDSFYQQFADAAAAAPALTGNSLVLTPAGAQYQATWGSGTYVAPTAGAVNVFATATDDGEALVVPSIPFASPTGPQATLRVHSNGLVSWGAAAQTFPGSNSYTPTPSAFLNGANAGICAAWHDWNESETGSGRIKREQAVVGTDTILYLTWDNVESYSTPLAVNPGTMQIQMNLTSGVVTVVWSAIDSNITSGFGSGYLVGYSAAGASQDAGSLVLATDLPLVTQSVNAAALALAASPAPVSNGVLGTVVTYTTSNMPEFAPGSGIYIGMNVLSLGQAPLGVDLTAIGASGCKAYISSLDFTQTMLGATSTQTVSFTVPTSIVAGFELYSQSVSLMLPFSLPNGQNMFGLTVSNGVRQRIDSF